MEMHDDSGTLEETNLTYQILQVGETVDSLAYLNFLERRVLPEVD